MSSRYERVPYLVAYQNVSGVRDVYGGVAELVVLECYQLKPETPSDTVLVFMHPIGGGAYLPMVITSSTPAAGIAAPTPTC
mgnify:CR=1 FL=1